MLTVCLYIMATGDPNHIATDYGVASLAYRIGGIWGPTIVCGIGGLIPIGLGIMNFLGFGIVVFSWVENRLELIFPRLSLRWRRLPDAGFALTCSLVLLAVLSGIRHETVFIYQRF